MTLPLLITLAYLLALALLLGLCAAAKRGDERLRRERR